MPFADPQPPSIDAGQNAVDAYRAPSLAAIVSLGLGLLSPLAFVGPALWVIPAAGALAGATALRSLSLPGATQTGRPLAGIGLLLCLALGLAAPVESIAAPWFLTRSADPFARAFLAELLHGQPQNAFQFRQPAAKRRPLDDRVWDEYRLDERLRRELTTFTSDPIVKALLLLGPRAETRLYEVGDVEYDGDRQTLPLVYAITFDHEGQRTTLFATVMLDRVRSRNEPPYWRVQSISGPVRPTPWER